MRTHMENTSSLHCSRAVPAARSCLVYSLRDKAGTQHAHSHLAHSLTATITKYAHKRLAQTCNKSKTQHAPRHLAHSLCNTNAGLSMHTSIWHILFAAKCRTQHSARHADRQSTKTALSMHKGRAQHAHHLAETLFNMLAIICLQR